MATSPEKSAPSDDLEPEYDFRPLRGVVRGKYAARYQERLRLVRLAPDVSEAFADEAAVNADLREYLTWRGSHGAGSCAGSRQNARIAPIKVPEGEKGTEREKVTFCLLQSKTSPFPARQAGLTAKTFTLAA